MSAKDFAVTSESQSLIAVPVVSFLRICSGAIHAFLIYMQLSDSVVC